MIRRKPLLAAVMGAGVFAAGAAQAENLRYAIGWPPNTRATEAVQTFADVAEEESGGDLTVKVYPLSLLNFLEASSGVRDGIADITTILLPYFISEFPTSNFGTELAGLVDIHPQVNGRSDLIFAGAFSEWAILNCPACVEEFAQQNQVFIGGGSSPSYNLICNTEITTEEDLQGARIRAGGAWWARWVETMGATAVSMSINETFEGLSQGVLDCSASSNSELSNFGFIDVATHITEGVPGAVYPSATASVNRDVWGGLTDEERTAMMRAAAAVAAHMTWNYRMEAQANVEEAEERGIVIQDADPALIEKSHAYIAEDAEALVASYEERFGLENGDQLLSEMKRLIDKWAPLVQDIDNVEDLTQLYWDEVMSKVDVTTYGQ